MAQQNKSAIKSREQAHQDETSDFWPSGEFYPGLFQGAESGDLEAVFSRSAGDSLFKAFYRTIIGFFERSLGVKFRLELPVFIRDKRPDLWSVLEKIASLKNKGLIDGFHYSRALFNDDPRFIMFNILTEKGTLGNKGGLGAGKAFRDEKKALQRALGEAVERISLRSYCPSDMLVSSFVELGDKAVNPDSFVGLGQERRSQIQSSDHFRRFHPKAALVFDKKTKFRWVKARSFSDGKTKLVPFQLVSLHRSAYDNRVEPFIRFPLSSGAAAGETADDALLAGLLEVIERDAFMITWFNQLSPEIIDLETGSDNLRKIARMFKRYRLDFRVAVMPTDLNVPVFLGVVIDRSGLGPAVVVGTTAGFDFSAGVESVATDVLAMRMVMRNRAANAGLPGVSHLSLDNRAFYWYPEKMADEIEFLVKGEKKPLSYFENKYSAALAKKDTAGRLRFLKERLEKLNLDAYWIEITAPELSYLDIHAVMAVVPKMQPLYVDECFAYIEGERLEALPGKFGFQPRRGAPSHPHPFA